MAYRSSSASNSISPADTSLNREIHKGTNTAAGPSIPCLAFGDNRRRGFALAVVTSVLRTASDAQEREHRSHCKTELLHDDSPPGNDELTVTAYCARATF